MIIKPKTWDFPGGPVVKTLHFPMQDVWVQSLVRELRSHIPWGGLPFASPVSPEVGLIGGA